MLSYHYDEMNFNTFSKRRYSIEDLLLEARLIPDDGKRIEIYDIKKDRIMVTIIDGYGTSQIYTDETHCCGAADFRFVENAVCPACKQSNDAGKAKNHVLEALRKEGTITQYYEEWLGLGKGYAKKVKV